MYFGHAPKPMIRLSVKYWQDSKIKIKDSTVKMLGRGHPYNELMRTGTEPIMGKQEIN